MLPQKRHGSSDMDSMADMGGMDMSSNVMFATDNERLARGFWWFIIAACALAFLIRIINFIQTSIRLRMARSRAYKYPTQPRNSILKAYATVTAIYREVVTPEVTINIRGLSWLSPPALGKTLLLCVYWAIIAYMLTSNAIVVDAYYWERIAFRAAWVSASQIPLVYLLAQKASIIGFITGFSYERLNWMHRWVSRTLLITVTVHGAFFLREWWMADFVALEIEIMPMVKYGIGAWFILAWTTFSSLAPLRELSYKIFVIQHLAAAAVLLWVLYIHIPSYAQYWVMIAVAAVVFDKAFLWGLTAWENLSIKKATKFGHRAELNVVEGDVTQVVVHDVGFKWSAGQHINLRIPAFGPFETHPFTIANVYREGSNNTIQLLIKSKKGFTKRLARAAAKEPGSAHQCTALVTGPFGYLPDWKSFETLVLISASTGSSFTLPILDSILTTNVQRCVTRIDLLLIVRNRKQIAFHLPRLNAAQEASQSKGVMLDITVAITCPCDKEISDTYVMDGCNAANDEMAICKCGNKVRSEILLRSSSATSNSISSEKEVYTPLEDTLISTKPSSRTSISDTNEIHNINQPTSKTYSEKISIKPICHSTSSAQELEPSTSDRLLASGINYTIGSRPDLGAYIRKPVDYSGGETCVAVCGGRELVAEVRRRVAALSDERAVHKGTDAQGIAIWGETYAY